MFRGTLGRTLGNMGCVARMLGQPEYAWECLREALQIGEETGGLDSLTCALPGVALLLADRGERERAVELVALVWRHPSVSNSRWFQDVYGRHMAAVAAALPPEAVAAAQERGRARDLWATARELLRELG